MNFPAIVGGDFCYSRALGIDCQRCVNWFVESVPGPGAKTSMALMPTPGTKKFVDLPASYEPRRIRGMYFTSRGLGNILDGMMVVVASENVYWVKQDGTYQLLGSISPGPDPVGIVDDGQGMVIADGSGMWRLEFSTGIWSSMGTEAPIATSKVAVLNQYTIAIGKRGNEQTNYWYFSKPFQNDEWPALNYYQATTSADAVTAIQTVASQLWLFGPRSYEVWTISGNSKKPFSRLAGAAGGVGILAPGSLGKMNDRLFFLGGGDNGTAIAYVTNGYQVERISTHPLEQEWAGYSVASDAVGFCYAQEGHMFWVLTFPAGGKTYVYDLATGLWHQRATRDQDTDQMKRWAPIYCVSAYGKVFVGSLESAAVYELSTECHTEDGKPIVRRRTSPHVANGMARMRHDALTLDCVVGQALPSGQGSAPQMMLRYSDDGGHTWSSEIWCPVGKQGDYKALVQWRRLGMARDRVYELTYSDPAGTAIMGADIAAVPMNGRS